MTVKRKTYLKRYRNPKIFSTSRQAKVRNRKTPQLLSGIFKILLIFILLWGINTLLTSDYFKIKNVKVRGDQDFISKVEELTKDELSKPSLFLFKSDNFFLFNPNKMKDEITSKIRDIKYVTINKRIPNSLDIEIKERKAKIAWITNNKKYLVDEDGFMIKEVENFSDIPMVLDISNLPVKDNTRLIHPNFISFIDDLPKSFKNINLGVDIDHYEIKETTFIINIVTKQGFKISFDTTKGLNGQFSKLEGTLKQLGEQKNNLDYIDLTIENKAIYKFK